MRTDRWMLGAALVGGALFAAVPSCGGTPDPGVPSADTDGGGTTPGGQDAGQVIVDEAGVPVGDPTVVDPSPTSPADDTGKPLGWAPAPLMDGVSATMGRDSAIVVVPVVAGARDYRVMTVPAGVDVTVDGAGKERVAGSTIYCAGLKQRSGPAGAAAEVLRRIQVAGLSAETRLVVEAIDTTCPFPGTLGKVHAKVAMTNAEVPPADRVPFEIYTEAEVRSTYGSLIVNGHAANSSIGTPAPGVAPKVLARTTVRVTPLGYANPPTKTFWEDFNGASPVQYGSNPNPQYVNHFQTDKWTFSTIAADVGQIFFDRGQMHVVLADNGQDVFGSVNAIPKHAVQLSSTDYLHVTFEVASTATERRYWWISMCGSDQAGQTIGADGAPLAKFLQNPFFMDDDGLNPTDLNWDCLQVFPRGGWPDLLGPSKTNPESEVRVMLNKAGNFPRDNVINVSPRQYGTSSLAPASWFRTQNASGQVADIMLDDQHNVAPNTHLDFWIRRDRFVMFANGTQKICNDFPTTPLTMAEGALNFGQVLYHSSAEHASILQGEPWDRSGMRYVLTNEPYVDSRTWDNVGFDEHVQAPPGLDEKACYKKP
jgi:hypothetical protein